MSYYYGNYYGGFGCGLGGLGGLGYCLSGFYGSVTALEATVVMATSAPFPMEDTVLQDFTENTGHRI